MGCCLLSTITYILCADFFLNFELRNCHKSLPPSLSKGRSLRNFPLYKESKGDVNSLLCKGGTGWILALRNSQFLKEENMCRSVFAGLLIASLFLVSSCRVLVGVSPAVVIPVVPYEEHYYYEYYCYGCWYHAPHRHWHHRHHGHRHHHR
ncbi:MAG: hypothetical protein G01um101448_188 [Parcubacteria group bacterium Gr01-1014_48]|nr:MAG: hypothetical protein G01um101448_188 [Parcubacteria group bacterium Gr01-1014_48]